MEYYNINKNSQFLISQSALIIKGNKLLVLRNTNHKLNNEYGGYWVVPGGLLEMDEGLQESLLREIEEETNLRVKISKVVAVGSFPVDKFVLKDGRVMKTRVIRIFYLSESFTGKIKLGDEGEHDEFMWASVEDVSGFKTFTGNQPGFKWFVDNYK